MENVKFSDIQVSSVVVNVVFSHTLFPSHVSLACKREKKYNIRTVYDTIDHRNYVHDLHKLRA